MSRSRSRLSSSAAAAYDASPWHPAEVPSSGDSLKDRPEARRRLGRNGRVFHDLGGSSSSNSDSEGYSETDTQLLQLQIPPDGYIRRMTFSNGGAPPGPQQQQQQQGQPDATRPVLLPIGTRLWRGAAASVCANQRLQSLERHAAELKQRQEVHTELKAWVEQVLSDSCRLQQEQDPQEDPTVDADWGHNSGSDHDGQRVSHGPQQQQQQQHSHHHHRHHHYSRHRRSLHPDKQLGQQQQLEGAEGQQQGGDSPPRRHSHRHRRHHRHHHGADGELQQPEGAAAGAAAYEAAGAASEGQSTGLAEPPAVGQLVVAPVEGTSAQAEQWQQFNPAEQQLIAQMQQDQQLLLQQLQQAYQHIAALTAQQDAAGTAAEAGACVDGPLSGDVVLQPGPNTQVLLLGGSSNSDPAKRQSDDSSTPVPGGSSEQQQLVAGPPDAACEPGHPPTARGSSSSSASPRGRLASKTSTARQSDAAAGGSKTPRAAAAGRAQKAAAAASGTAPADKARSGSPGRKSLQAAQAAASKPRASLAMPQGRGLTLAQQQALVQRLQQAEEVMDLLQQDLQESLEAQQQLQEQVGQLQEAASQNPDSTVSSGNGPQQGDAIDGMQDQAACGDGQQSGEPSSWGASDAGVQCADRQGLEAVTSALELQLQEHQQQLAAAQATAAEQQQLIAELQQQLESCLAQEQQQVGQIASLSEQLAEAAQQLQALQAQQQQQQCSAGTLDTPILHDQQLQQPEAAAGGGPVCCQHETRCQQLQGILQALLRQLQSQEGQPPTQLRPQTAAVQGSSCSPRVRAVWQHRPVELHTWLCPGPPQQARPMTPRLAQPPAAAQVQQAAAQQRSASVPRCSSAASSSLSPTLWPSQRLGPSSPRCNTSGPLTARCGSGAAGFLQQDNMLQPLEYKLRPLTYRGPDRAASDAVVSATGGRRQLSVDAQQGLLASLRVAPFSARGGQGSQGAGALQSLDRGDTGQGGGAAGSSLLLSPRRQQPGRSPRSGRGHAAGSGVPRLVLTGLQ